MIICQCCVIRTSELKSAVRELINSNPKAQVTPNRVYRQLGKSPTCAECAPLLIRRINQFAHEIAVRENILKGQEMPRRLQ